MASHSLLPFTTLFSLSLFIFLSLFTSSSHSAPSCGKLPSNRTFENCTALPALGATLHFTHNATNRSLAVALSAAPPSPSGWVAWGVNLVGTGMVGAQVFLAYPHNGTVGVHRYNLTSYKGIDEVKTFTFDSWDLSAEQSNGVTTIYATVKLPEGAENVNYVWQVGPVAGGKLAIHDTKPDNLAAKAVLPVASTAASGNATAPASGEKSGVGERFGVQCYFRLVLALMIGLVVAL